MSPAPQFRRASIVTLATFSLIGVTALAGCSAAGGGEGESSDGVPWGASPEEFQAALADMDPVVLTIQSAAQSADAPSAAPTIALGERLDEYSGGKITLEIAYNNGIVPVTDVDTALVDGRLDLGQFTPIYEPSEYPANAVLIEATLTRDPSLVVGGLQTHAAMAEVAWNTPGVVAEFEDQGLFPAIPITPGGAVQLLCKEPLTDLDDFEGLQIRASGTGHSREIEEMGATPVSLTFPDVYEGLQRRIIDCAVAAYGTAVISGWFEVAPNVVYSDSASFPGTPGMWLLGGQYPDLPLAARQLIYDSIIYAAADTLSYDLNVVIPAAHGLVEQYGGEFLEMDDDTSDAINAANDKLADAWATNPAVDGQDFVDRVYATQEKWHGIIADLGYADEGSPADYLDWYTPDLDLDPWAQAYYDEVGADHRPS